MTILPKRNKRRLDQRDQESSQQLAQQGPSTSLLEVQPTHHSNAAGSLQIDTSHNHSLIHSLNHGHQCCNDHHSTVHNHQHHTNAYNAIIYNHISENTRASTTRAQTALSVDTKWRRPPPVRALAPSDDKYIPPHKKSNRSKTKLKHAGSYDYSQVQDNHSTHTKSLAGTTSTYGSFLPQSATSQQSRQILISPSGQNVSLAQLSPKMPGGAQQKSGAGQQSRSPDNDPNHSNDDEEFQNTASPGGCNSEDEHVPSQQEDHTEELEKPFEVALKNELGLVIRHMEMDGSCLFRAIADQVYGDQDMHDVVRQHCIDYMAKNADHFSNYVTEDFTTYLQRKRQLGCHGNHMEVQALSEMYNRPIEVYQYALKPMNIFHGSYRPESVFPIRISYHRNTHYNSLIDPEKPTIGVGLGLSDFQPRTVEKNLVAEAKASSENYQLEQAMLTDKLRETDWEITDEAINEQVARESYAQWLQDCQKQKRRTPACTVTGPSCSSVTEETVNWMEKLSPGGSPRLTTTHSPKSDREKSTSSKSGGAVTKLDAAASGEQASSSSTLNLSMEASASLELQPFSVYNYNDSAGEKEALIRALAESQQDFIDRMLQK